MQLLPPSGSAVKVVALGALSLSLSLSDRQATHFCTTAAIAAAPPPLIGCEEGRNWFHLHRARLTHYRPNAKPGDNGIVVEEHTVKEIHVDYQRKRRVEDRRKKLFEKFLLALALLFCLAPTARC